MIHSAYNKETGIIESRLTGMVTVEEVFQYINKLKDLDKYPKRMLILTDSIHGRFEFSEEEDRQMVRLVTKYITSFDLIKDAIIVDDPRTTAFSILFRRAASSLPNYHFEVFSTREAALKWLLS